MSQLAHAGESSTASPGRAASRARATASAIVPALATGTWPSTRLRIAGASRPISTTLRILPADSRRTRPRGSKSAPLPSPPAMRTSGTSKPPTAATVAPTLVPFESSYQRTPPVLAIGSQRCARPRNPRSASSIVRGSIPRSSAIAIAARALSALWRPGRARWATGNRRSVPRASHVPAPSPMIPYSPSRGRSAVKEITRAPFRARRMPRSSSHGSSRPTTAASAPRNTRALAAR